MFMISIISIMVLGIIVVVDNAVLRCADKIG